MAPPITISFPGVQWRRSAGNDLVTLARSSAASIADARGQRIVGTDYGYSHDENDDTYSLTFDAGLKDGAPEALTTPAYRLADLPSASKNPNGTVKILDNPQGTAQSNGVTWLSDVDGTDLGPGNG